MSTQTPSIPTSFGSRVWTYIVEMYPLHVNVPYSFLSFYGFYLILQAIYGLQPLTITWQSGLGALTMVAFTLLLRIFDEFKDYEHDCKLFPHRPLPSGRVLKSDLKALGWGLVAAMIGFNLFLGKGLIGFAALMAFGFLMLKYFFLPDLHRKSLLLTLATHNPIVLFTHLYVLSVFMEAHGVEAIRPAAWAAIAMFWLLVFSWETCRKIRAKEEEDDYVTYSQIFGTRRSALVPMAGVTASAALLAFFGSTLGLSSPFLGVMALAYGYSMFGFVRWLVVQNAKTSKLKPFVESYTLVLYVALAVELVRRFGVAWG